MLFRGLYEKHFLTLALVVAGPFACPQKRINKGIVMDQSGNSVPACDSPRISAGQSPSMASRPDPSIYLRVPV